MLSVNFHTCFYFACISMSFMGTCVYVLLQMSPAHFKEWVKKKFFVEKSSGKSSNFKVSHQGPTFALLQGFVFRTKGRAYVQIPCPKLMTTNLVRTWWVKKETRRSKMGNNAT